MGLLEQCGEAFGARDLYQVLGVPCGASAEEIRRAYRKASLRVHPDRADLPDKETATRRFQILGKVYAVLTDQEQRTLYDQQGNVDEESTVLSQDRDWEEYWKLIFKEVTLKDIEDFKKQYSDSAEEVEDIKTAYKNCKGNMEQIMEKVLCADYTDEPRIRKIIQQAIDLEELPFYKAFAKESKKKMSARKRKAEREAREAEKAREELGLDKDDDVKALIQRRNENRKKEMDDFLAQMEAKYGNSSKKGGKKTSAKKGIK